MNLTTILNQSLQPKYIFFVQTFFFYLTNAACKLVKKKKLIEVVNLLYNVLWTKIL
jgi:hypothetical protein